MRLILFYDKKVGYTVLGHNYEDEAADKIVRAHRALGKPAYFMEQKGTHKGGHEGCRACAKAAERMAKRR